MIVIKYSVTEIAVNSSVVTKFIPLEIFMRYALVGVMYCARVNSK